MRDVNKVILIGRLGKDPDIVNFESGTKKGSFPLATGESYTDRNGQRVDHTEWHNIVVWRRLAEIVEQYLKKGDPVYIEGKLRTRSYDDREGNKKYITEIEVLNLSMLGSRSDSSSGSSTSTEAASASTTPATEPAKQDENSNDASKDAEEPAYDDDLPF